MFIIVLILHLSTRSQRHNASWRSDSRVATGWICWRLWSRPADWLEISCWVRALQWTARVGWIVKSQNILKLSEVRPFESPNISCPLIFVWLGWALHQVQFYFWSFHCQQCFGPLQASRPSSALWTIEVTMNFSSRTTDNFLEAYRLNSPFVLLQISKLFNWRSFWFRMSITILIGLRWCSAGCRWVESLWILTMIARMFPLFVF